jgi:hypothetical protein
MRIPDSYAEMIAHDAVRLMKTLIGLTDPRLQDDGETRSRTDARLRELRADLDTSPAERHVIDALRRLMIDDAGPLDTSPRGWVLYVHGPKDRTATYYATRAEAEQEIINLWRATSQSQSLIIDRATYATVCAAALSERYHIDAAILPLT